MLEPLRIRPYVLLDPTPWFDFPWHSLASSRQEGMAVGRAASGYEMASGTKEFPPGVSSALPYFAQQQRAPSLITLTLGFEGMVRVLTTDGRPDLTACPELNLYRLERLYRKQGLARLMAYQHPAYGPIKVRFAAPLRLPPGLPRAGGTTASFEVKLQVVPDNRLVKRAWARAPRPVNPTSGGYEIFPFRYHTTEVNYQPTSAQIPLGGNYFFTTATDKAEQRTFTLEFAAFRWCLASDGRPDPRVMPELNLANLEMFYDDFRVADPFILRLEDYGDVLVRFKRPLEIPAGVPNGDGVVEGIRIELIEVAR